MTLRELRGDGDFALSSWMNGIALVLASLERPDEAEALLRESLSIHCRAYGAECPNRMRTLFELARMLVEAGRSGEAVEYLDELLAASERAGAEEHPMVREARELARGLE